MNFYRLKSLAPAAIIAVTICFGTEAGSQSEPFLIDGFPVQPDLNTALATPSCNVPIHKRLDFGMNTHLVPANCVAWTDGCNTYVRFADGAISRTLQHCFRCPAIVCTKRPSDN
jgi:hypothetical protein